MSGPSNFTLTSRAVALAASVIALAAVAAATPHAPRPSEGDLIAVLRKCATCHGGKTPAGNLDLTNRDSALKGGKSGPAIVPGNALQSRAYALASARKMPPDSPL